MATAYPHYIYKVFGPPGTGKTTILIDLVKKAVLTEQYRPGEVAFLSFSRAAAFEARSRILEQFPFHDPEEFPYFSTVHGLARRILGVKKEQLFCNYHKKFQEKYRYDLTPPETDIDELFPTVALRTDGDLYQAFWSYARHIRQEPEQAFRAFYRMYGGIFDHPFSLGILTKYRERLERFKQFSGEHPTLYDFDDLLEMALNTSLGVRLMIVDEVQDNSPLLQAVVNQWAEECEILILAGDPYQAIYTFQGADPGIMLDYPGESITLAQSYRCPAVIQATAAKITARMKQRYNDSYIPATHAGGVSFGRFKLDFDGTAFYLCRTNYQVSQVAKKLMDLKIPFGYVSGKKKSPFRNAAWQAYLAALRWQDEKVIPLDTLAQIIDYLTMGGVMKHGTKTRIKEAATLAQKPVSLSPGDLLELGFTPAGVEKVRAGTIASEFKDGKLLTLDKKLYLRDMYRLYSMEELLYPRLAIGTIHSSKGKEADVVFIDPALSAKVQDAFDRNPDPEHRLAYVAMTRARHQVVIIQDSASCGMSYNYPVLRAVVPDITAHEGQDRSKIIDRILESARTLEEDEQEIILPF